MHKSLQKIVALFQKPSKGAQVAQLEEYLEKKRKIWDESLRYIEELSLTKT